MKIIPRVVNSELPNLLNQNSIYLQPLIWGLQRLSWKQWVADFTIAYSAPGIEEIILDNENGFLTKPSPYFVNDILQKLKKIKSNFKIGICKKYILEKNSFEKF